MAGWAFLGTVFPRSSLSTCSPSSPGQPYAGSGREDLGLQPGRGEVAEATGPEKYDPTQFEPPGSSKVTRDFRGTTSDVRTLMGSWCLLPSTGGPPWAPKTSAVLPSLAKLSQKLSLPN